MSISPDAAALVILCRPDGALVEVIYDELGLPTSADFFSLVHKSSARKAKRFLRVAVASHFALDWELTIPLASGVVQLFFCATITRRGIVVIGMKDPAVSREFPKSVFQQAASLDSQALQNLNQRRGAKLRVGRKLRRELSRLNDAVAAAAHQNSTQSSSRASQARPNHLIQMLAHDLKNPISGILSASQYLIDDAAPVLDRDHLMLLRSIESSSGLMLRLIEDLVELPSAGLEKPRLHLQPTDLALLVDQSVAVYRPLAEARNVRLEIKRDDDIRPVPLDSVKIRQSLNALLTNAVRSSPPGGEIQVRIAAEPKNIVITVANLGNMTAERHPNSKPGASKRSHQGAIAITLSAVRQIARAHGGSLRLDKSTSRPAFRLALPRNQRSMKRKALSSAAP